MHGNLVSFHYKPQFSVINDSTHHMCMVFSDSLIQTSEEALVERVQERDQKDDGRRNRAYRAEGGGPGQL